MGARFFAVLIAAASLLLAPISTSFAQDPKPLTNADVVKLVKAGLPESTVLLTIQASPTQFDTSPDQLIKLKKDGVSTKIVEAMLQAGNKQRPAAAPAPSPAASSPPQNTLQFIWGSKQTRIEADRVFLIEGDKRTEMKFTTPGTRSRFVYSIQVFAVIPGLKARLRLETNTPQFELILPNNVEISSILAMALLGARQNGTREILIGGGFMSISQGLPNDRNIALSYEKSPDQALAPEGYEIYRVRPNSPLKPGEYAFMVTKPGMAMGPLTGANFNYNFYEFGVD